MRATSAAAVILVVVAMMCGAPLCAQQLLWYNGDADGANALINTHHSAVEDARVYDDFIVPVGQTWSVSALFSNDAADFAPVAYDWEIRQGVSAGDGGTLLFSASGASGTSTPTGRQVVGISEFHFEVPVSFDLGPGTYWLMVRPVGQGVGFSYASSTSGANGVGSPQGNDGDSFFSATSFGANFTPIGRLLSSTDFSMGVKGVVQGDRSPNPEPTPAVAGLACIASVGAVFSRRLRR